MIKISKHELQKIINTYANKSLFIHLETTNGAYANHKDEKVFNAGAFIRNAPLSFQYGKVTGEGPFRIGLKLDYGWVYAEGLTDWEIDEQNRLLLAGHDFEGRLAVALQMSEQPFL